MEINRPEVRRQVEAAFRRYEAALMANDVDTLNELFWRSPETVRYGPTETLYGHDTIAAFRDARDIADISRTLTRTVITTYGTDHATAFAEYRRHASGRVGRQSQTWVRMAEGWRVVAAHVSLLPPPDQPRRNARGEPTMPTITLPAAPAPIDVDLRRAAVLVIDMQRDFLEPGGFGETLGNDVSLLRGAIAPCAAVLAAARGLGLLVVHTREGHRPDMTDAPAAKVERGAPSRRIGDAGPMGRILIRGEPGHDIVAELAPAPGEPVLDKPGKGAFYQTDLELVLRNRGIEALLVAGVTTEVCVHTTIREANDRGFRCIALGDCCASYFPEFHEVGLRMIAAQGGIFGWVSDSASFLGAVAEVRRTA